MGSMSLVHWLIVGFVVLLFFGKGRFSSMMSDVAKGLKRFKKGMAEEDEAPVSPHRLEGDRTVDIAAERSRSGDPQERREP